MVEAPRISRQWTALRTGRLYPQEISTYVGGWPLSVDASTDTLYLVISNRPRSYIGPFTWDQITLTGTYIMAFLFCSESPVLQVQNKYFLSFTNGTFIAGLLAKERTTSLLHSALEAYRSAFGPAIKKYCL